MKGNGKNGLEVVQLPVGELKPYFRNPRKKNDAVRKVAESIKNFGWRQPIVVDENMTVVVGHTRLEAAKRLGLEEVPVHIAEGMDEQKAKAYRLADNRLNEEASWDLDMLAEELQELAGEKVEEWSGFDKKEIDEITKPIEEKTEPEVRFTEELLEEHQYVVLYFDNTVDWQTAKEVLDLETVKEKDERGKYTRRGLGRVLRGADVVERLMG